MAQKVISDYALAAYLTLKGFKQIIAGEARHIQFIFEESPQLTEEISNFFNHKAPIDALSYFQAVKATKSMLVQLRRDARGASDE